MANLDSALALALLALPLATAPGCGPGGGTSDGGADGATLDSGPDADAGACSTGAPSGFSIIVPAQATGKVGVHTAMALDEADDPLVAYVWDDPNGDTDHTDSTLHFVRWDRCAAAWTQPVMVDLVADIETNQPSRNIAIARDASNGAIGILYQKASHVGQSLELDVLLATSTDDGKSWNSQTVSEHKSQDLGLESARNPALAMAAGHSFAAYGQSWQLCLSGKCDGGYYVQGATRQPLPLPPSTIDVDRASTVALAVDGAGQPGVAYVVEPTNASSDKSLVFWRPGGAPVVVTTTANVPNDDGSVSLAFDGQKPRIAAHFVRDLSGTHDLIFAASDDGTTWNVAPLPRDGNDVTAWYQSIAIGAQGKLAVAAYWNGGTPGGQCGGPKILRSPDGTTWTPCGANTTRAIGTLGLWVSAAYGKSDKLALAFLDIDDLDPAQPPGVLFWRE